jgi:hypothetical protein
MIAHNGMANAAVELVPMEHSKGQGAVISLHCSTSSLITLIMKQSVYPSTKHRTLVVSSTRS